MRNSIRLFTYIVTIICLLCSINPHLAQAKLNTPTVAGFPFSDNFESGIIGADWSSNSSGAGQVEISTENPHAGSYSIFMGKKLKQDATANLFLTTDLAGQNDVFLDFWWRANEEAGDPDNGVYISDNDGASWSKIYDLGGNAQGYMHAFINVADAAADRGLTLNNHFRIYLYYESRYFNNVGGLYVDDFQLTTRNQVVASFPAADAINKGERPLILAGHGVQLGGVSKELLELVEKAEIPVVTTLLGTGNIPESHPLSLGMGGMHGEAFANRAVQNCDVLIAMGMRFDDRITGRLDRFAKQATIIHFELDKAEVGKNVVPDIPVVGDLGETLPALLPLIEDRRHQVWIQELREWRDDTTQTDIINYEVDQLIPPFVIRQLWHSTKDATDGAIIVTDVGQHQMWECQYYTHDISGQLLTSGGLGTMGYALPAAIGAQMAYPDRLVWAVAGDGGFQMTLQELAVLKQERNLPVKIAIINNGFLGMVRQWQQLFYEKRYTGTPVVSPDFVKLADAYGIPALKVTQPSQVAEAFKTANETPGPFLIDFRVKEEVNVYPMIAPGAAVDEPIRRPKPMVVQGYSGVEPSW